jgi:uncharacterized membrane protein
MNSEKDKLTGKGPDAWGDAAESALPRDATGKPYRRESHARSLIKGVSWRIVATVDTIVIVALITLFASGKMSLTAAFHIGLAEFLIKFVVYYVHERIWEGLRTGSGLKKRRTLKKAISWRIIATAMTFTIAAFVLGSETGADKSAAGGIASLALAIAVVEFFTKFALYYVHERVWAKIPLGKIRNWLFGKKNA